MVYVVSTVIVLGVLIFVHELGHFLLAKLLGVRVERFSLGFPPKLAGFKLGETEYLISFIPLGGYVKMFGENPDEEDGVPPEEQRYSFSHKPPWVRFLIVLAGPAFNFLFAVVVFCAIFMAAGIPHLDTTIGEVQKNMPAAAAGLSAGDRILSVNKAPVTYWDNVSEKIRAGAGREVEIAFLRQGREMTVSIKPQMVAMQDIFGEETQVPQVGIMARGDVVIESVGPISALYHGLDRTWDVVELTFLSVVKLIERKIPLKTVGGPIFIAQLAGQQAKAGVIDLILLMAVLSVNLGIINLFPVPILDGGHLFFFLMEMAFRRPISLRTREIAQQVGIIFLVMLMALIFYNDLDRIFGFSHLFIR